MEWTSGTSIFLRNFYKLKVLSNIIYHATLISGVYQKPGVGSSETLFPYEEGGKSRPVLWFNTWLQRKNVIWWFIQMKEKFNFSVSTDAQHEKKGDQYSVISLTEHLPLFSLGILILYVIKILIWSIFFRGNFSGLIYLICESMVWSLQGAVGTR